MRYEGDIYSPHIAGDDYILQCTIGCSHNRCTFCYMYKDKEYRQREVKEILKDVDLAKEYYGDIEKVFLGDGDALTMAAPDLIKILDYLYAAFPSLSYVGTYASARSILNKTHSELRELRQHGLVEAHLGVESGDEEVLREVRKGVSYDEMVEAGRKLKDSGITLFVTVILGLAGRTRKAIEHAQNTAKICNDIQPDYIGFLNVILQQGTELYEKNQRGEFEIPSDMEILREMYMMIENMNLGDCGITSIHPSNQLSLDGHLPEDKEQVMQTIKRVLDGTETFRLRPRETYRI